MSRFGSFGGLVTYFGVTADAKAPRTLRALRGTKKKRSERWVELFAAPRWKTRFFGRQSEPVPQDKAEAFSSKLDWNRHAVGRPATPQQRELMAEIIGREKTVALLQKHLDGDRPLTHRVLQDYKAVYGRDLINTYVTDCDLVPLHNAAERVRKTDREERRGIVLVNPRIEATKRAVRMAIDEFRAAPNKSKGHRNKLKALLELQASLDAIGPRANADEVEAMAREAVDGMGLSKRRFFGLGRLKYGVDVDFGYLLELARASVDREFSGKPKAPDQEMFRHAVSHTVAKLNADVAEIDRKILELRHNLKAEPGRSRPANATPKDIRRDIKHLKAARDTIQKKVLPNLSKEQSRLDHLRFEGDARFEDVGKEIEDELKAADAALADHADALNRQGVPTGLAHDPAADEQPLGGNGLLTAPYSSLFSSLKDDPYGVLAAKLDPEHSVAKRLQAATQGRPWLWTPMTAEDDGIYRSQPVKAPSELGKMDVDPNEHDAPAISQEMRKLAASDDGADGLRRRILRLGQERRLDLLRKFEAQASSLTHRGLDKDARLQKLEAKADELLTPVIDERNARMALSRAKRFFARGAWPEEVYRSTVNRRSNRHDQAFLADHKTLREEIDKAEAALKSGYYPSAGVLDKIKASAEKLKAYFNDAKESDLTEDDRAFLDRLDAVNRNGDVLLRQVAKKERARRAGRKQGIL